MEILWHGQSCFEIRAPVGIAVADPFAALRQPLPAASTANLVSHSRRDVAGEVPGAESPGRPFLIDRPGEYEAHGIFVIALETYADPRAGAGTEPNLVCCFDFPGLTVCHFGQRCDRLSQAQVELLGNVHVLLLPVGLPGQQATSLAVEVVNLVDPALVIPMYASAGDPAADPAMVQFLKEMGVTELAPKNQLRVDAGRLPEEPQVALLGVAR